MFCCLPGLLPQLYLGHSKCDHSKCCFRLQSIGDVSKTLQTNVERMQSAQQTAAQKQSEFETKLQEAKLNVQVCPVP